MKKGWQTKKLGEVADVYDGPHATPKTVDTGPIFLGISALRDGVIDFNETRHVTEEDFRQWTRRVKPQPNDVVFSYETRLGQAAIIPDGLKCCLGRRMGLVRFNVDEVAPRFFLYQYLSPPFRDYLNSKTVRGATVDRISIREFPYFQIAVPPLPEQHRIVSILDEAFDGLARATANAEQNLRNARALFESHLQSVFSQRGNGWVEKSIAECFKVRSGDFLPAKSMVETGDVNVYGGNGIAGRHDKKNLSGENIVIGRVGAKCGNVRLVLGDLWLTDNAFYISDFSCEFDLRFLARLLERKRLRGTANQAAQPVISYTTIKDMMLEFPVSKAEQKSIAQKLDALADETQRLESIYQHKLAALGELKKSLLHQAFSGAL